MAKEKNKTILRILLITLVILTIILIINYNLKKNQDCDKWAERENILIPACVGEWIIEDGECKWVCETQSLEDFCGFSTNAPCETNSECTTGGCSSQVCQGINEEGMITTCEYRECYNAGLYGLSCRCVENTCQWK
jgi:eight-cysteine-cluster-containing protein